MLSISRALQAMTFTQKLHNLYRFLITPHADDATPWQIIKWWWVRQIYYNVIMFVVGIAGIIWVLTMSFVIEPTGDVDFLGVLLLPVVGIVANLCYSLGWIIELLCFRGENRRKFGIAAFIAGTVFSLSLVWVPVVIVTAYTAFTLAVCPRAPEVTDKTIVGHYIGTMSRIPPVPNASLDLNPGLTFRLDNPYRNSTTTGTWSVIQFDYEMRLSLIPTQGGATGDSVAGETNMPIRTNCGRISIGFGEDDYTFIKAD